MRAPRPFPTVSSSLPLLSASPCSLAPVSSSLPLLSASPCSSAPVSSSLPLLSASTCSLAPVSHLRCLHRKEVNEHLFSTLAKCVSHSPVMNQRLCCYTGLWRWAYGHRPVEVGVWAQVTEGQPPTPPTHLSINHTRQWLANGTLNR